MKEIIDSINEIRKSNGLSYAEVGRRAEMPRQNVERALKGKNDPQVCTLYKIAKACGVKTIKID